MIRFRSSRSFLAVIAFAAIFAACPAAPARAGLASPDAPSWATARADASDGPRVDDAKLAASDPLDVVRDRAAAAQDALNSSLPAEALALVESSLRDLNAIVPAPQGAEALRDQLEGTRKRAQEQVDKAKEAVKQEEAKDAKDAKPAPDAAAPAVANDPHKLKPVVPETNERVEKWMTYYTGRGRDVFQKWLSRSGNYMDLLTQNLRAEGVPEELANLVFVESGFNMHARSVARAVGPWQFIRGTAKLFGLEITPYVDERRDPELATRAAAKYLRRLYEMFDGSWPLALAAYNSGEGTVLRAIKRQKTNDFWSLNLPRETREYVPQFMAAMEIASDPERYGFTVPENSPWSVDAITVRGPIDLQLLSKVTEVPLEELERLNPAFVRHRSPADKEGTMVRVPHGSGDQVQQIVDTKYHPRALTRAEIRSAARAHRLELKHSKRYRYRRAGNLHVVRRGETLSHIASRYGTSTTRLASLNGMSRHARIHAGQRIRVR
ncbi:MAG TPA: transglycosylase SLT domain-containing protein [Candidatus Binatia bacterium]|nr:transglycosylase SLT domain-containing protein [Candidatus Binatia bacterium]